MSAVLKRERILACTWMDIPLPNRIHLMRLDAAARSKEIGYLNLTYEFEGFEAYMNAKK